MHVDPGPADHFIKSQSGKNFRTGILIVNNPKMRLFSDSRCIFINKIDLIALTDSSYKLYVAICKRSFFYFGSPASHFPLQNIESGKHKAG
jgi:hypothetical protein